MSSQHPDHMVDISVLVRVLSTHLENLTIARADETMLRQYTSLLRFLKSKKGSVLNDIFASAGRKEAPPSPTYSFTEGQIDKFSLDELEKLVNDETVARSDLERIAVQRFKVPRGSVRSNFPNKRMLTDKLRVMIRNERAHGTISMVARDQAKHQSGETE
jgi:hypothetical protein